MFRHATSRSPGGEELLAAIHDALASGSRAVVQALRGTGGVGKTQVAVEYAHRFGHDYDAVWWVNAESAALIGEQFAALGADLRCVEAGAQLDAVRRQVLAALRALGSWLLIFDNAERVEDVTAWLPGGHGHVLITSRVHGWDEIAVPVEVGVLDRGESVELLRYRLRGLPDADADEVAEAVGDLPLAITQAAAFLARTGMPVGEYTRLLTERAAGVMAAGRPSSYPMSLAAATELALRRLRGDDRAAADLAVISAFFGPEPVPAGWFIKAAQHLPEALGNRVTDPVAWHRTLAALADSALARTDGAELVMHRLTQRIIRDQLPGELAAGILEQVGRVLTVSHPGETRTPARWGQWARLLPHLLALHPAVSSDPGLRSLAVDATWYLSRRGDIGGAYALASQLHRTWTERLGSHDPHVMLAAEGLAEALRGMGRYQEARELDEANFTWRRDHLGADHSETLAAAHDLAVDLRRLGDLDGSRQLHQDTLERRTRTLGEDCPETLSSAGNLAVTLRLLGELDAARELQENTLARRRRILGDDHPSTLASATNLANDLYDLGDMETARQLDEDTLARKRRTLGEDHPDTLISAYNASTSLRRTGKAHKARQLTKDTLLRFRRILGKDHPVTQTAAASADVPPPPTRPSMSDLDTRDPWL